MKNLIFITGNQHKTEELENYLGITVTAKKLDIKEIQSLDLEEVARVKAEAAYRLLGTPVLVEDTALTFTALGKLPGPLIRHFLETIGNEGLVKILSGYEDRKAVAESCFALADENGVKIFRAETSGTVALSPRGEMGFGWDAIFIPNGTSKTWAEMTMAEKQSDSMRARALDKLKEFLI